MVQSVLQSFIYSVWSAQSKVNGIPAACAQNLTQRGNKSQPTKQIMQNISLSLNNKTLFFIAHVVELYILTEILDNFQMSTSNIAEKNDDI